MQRWARLNYQINLPLREDGVRVTACREHIALSRTAAEEGMVLLKNEGKILPLAAGSTAALFGKASFDYVQGGGGSGEVFAPYTKNLYDGLREKGVGLFEPLSAFYRDEVKAQMEAGAVAGMTREPEVPDALLEQARSFTDLAIITLCRFSGEGWDRQSPDVSTADQLWDNIAGPASMAKKLFERGDFYLTQAEETMIRTVTRKFKRVVVVLNTGGVMDTRWIQDDPKIQGALVMWAAGMEGGSAAAAILTGEVNPSGRLSDTFAGTPEDYPSTETFYAAQDHVDYTEDVYVGYRYFSTMENAADRVVYPFGYGLSYTTFALSDPRMEQTEQELIFHLTVTNTGTVAGKQVVQIYCAPPQGKLLKPARILAAFAKTDLLAPGQAQRVTLHADLFTLASFDDDGRIRRSARLLEKGEYQFFAGENVRDAALPAGTLLLEEDRILEQLSAKLSPSKLSHRMNGRGEMEPLDCSAGMKCPHSAFEPLREEEMECLTPMVRAQGRRLFVRPYKEGAKTLFDLAEQKTTMEEFLGQLSDAELIDLLGGQPNTGVGITFGIGNLPDYAVPNAMTADGPAGVRIQPWTGVKTTAWPCATLLACSWNPQLVERVGAAGGAELKENNMAVWLTPAINIHRSPLCGRNFEYYSEDPLLTGKLAAAMVRGIQSNRVAACVKHFAFNNKETNRKNSDSRVSERAAREIYLRAFEIVIKESQPWTLMSSYNLVNGCRCAECKELLEDILRGEWGYRGLVVTDWWGYSEEYLEILAGNDVKMGLGYPERVEQAMQMGLIDRQDLLRAARRVIELLLRLD